MFCFRDSCQFSICMTAENCLFLNTNATVVIVSCFWQEYHVCSESAGHNLIFPQRQIPEVHNRTPNCFWCLEHSYTSQAGLHPAALITACGIPEWPAQKDGYVWISKHLLYYHSSTCCRHHVPLAGTNCDITRVYLWRCSCLLTQCWNKVTYIFPLLYSLFKEKTRIKLVSLFWYTRLFFVSSWALLLSLMRLIHRASACIQGIPCSSTSLKIFLRIFMIHLCSIDVWHLSQSHQRGRRT